MKRGYLTPPVILILALITLFVAAAIFFNTFLLKGLKKESAPVLTPTIQPSPKSATDETVYTDEGSANWKTYTNVEQGYSFRYPSNWQIAEPSFESGSIINTNNHTTKFINDYTYPEKGAGIFGPFASGSVMDYKSLDDLSDDFKSSSQNTESIMEKDFILARQPAKMLIIKHTYYYSVDVLFKYKVKTFETNYSFISMSSETADFNEYKSDFDEILSTFKFLD